jgi:hypothetical protein
VFSYKLYILQYNVFFLKLYIVLKEEFYFILQDNVFTLKLYIVLKRKHIILQENRNDTHKWHFRRKLVNDH